MRTATSLGARDAAARTLLRALQDDAYVDRALRAQAATLSPRDHGLARALTYAAVQRRATLAYWIEQFTGRPAAALDDEVLVPLQLGLVQLAFMDRVPPHAAVSETVDVAKRLSVRGGHRMVNAVLRRAVSGGLPPLPGDVTPADAAVTHSVPLWLAERWFAEYGADEARALLARCNEPAERAIRVNTLRATVDEVREALPVETRGDAELPHALVLEAGVDLEQTELWERGAIVAQSRGAQLAAHLLAPQPGEQVLDLCAAPGGKTSHLAALLGGGQGLVAVEAHHGRAAALRRTLDRLGASEATVVTGDALAPPPAMRGRFDAILLDPPCAALGTLQRQPDVRWRATPERIAAVAEGQRALLDAAITLLAPGGRLLYSVCSIGAAESDDVLTAAGVQAQLRRSVLPHRDLTDGFEYAVIGG
ncbi:MAG: transcription antitermination factor NusB [Patulibacter sp.]